MKRSIDDIAIDFEMAKNHRDDGQYHVLMVELLIRITKVLEGGPHVESV